MKSYIMPHILLIMVLFILIIKYLLMPVAVGDPEALVTIQFRILFCQPPSTQHLPQGCLPKGRRTPLPMAQELQPPDRETVRKLVVNSPNMFSVCYICDYLQRTYFSCLTDKYFSCVREETIFPLKANWYLAIYFFMHSAGFPVDTTYCNDFSGRAHGGHKCVSNDRSQSINSFPHKHTAE